MLSNTVTWITFLFQKMYQLFSMNVVGCNFSYIQLGLGCIAFLFVINFAKTMLGWSTGVAGSSQRGGQSRKIYNRYKVEKEKRG